MESAGGFAFATAVPGFLSDDDDGAGAFDMVRSVIFLVLGVGRGGRVIIEVLRTLNVGYSIIFSGQRPKIFSFFSLTYYQSMRATHTR